jgi:PAS domain-containing protein
MSHTHEGHSSELAMVGRHGLVGVACVLGSGSVNHRMVVQTAGQAFRMPAAVFQAELMASRPLQRWAFGHVQALLTQMAQSIVCIGHHSVSERVRYWLLTNQEALNTHFLKVTHESMANSLGVRRESVTQALGRLQAQGLVCSGRGKITVLDRDGLRNGVCECFGLVSTETRRQFDRMTRLFELQESEVDSTDGLNVQPLNPLQQYQDAYDFAPVGFVSLDGQARVIQSNLAGAIMLGIQRSRASLSPMAGFIQLADQGLFSAFHQEVLSGKCRRYCVVHFSATANRAEMVVRVDATLNESGDECRLVMTDVTQEKRLADLALAQERRHQEVLAKQSFKIWFKDQDARAQSDHAKWFNAWCDADALLTLQRPYGQPPDSSAVVSETPAPVGLGELGLEGPFAIAVPSAHRIRRTSQAAGQ